MNIKKILFVFFTLLFLYSCRENKNDEKTDTISTIEETKSQDEVEIDDYVSDEEFEEFYEKYPEFDDLDQDYCDFMDDTEDSENIKKYIWEHLDEFAQVKKQ